MECVKQFIKGIRHCTDLIRNFFYLMSPADAKRVEAMHYKEHGVSMLGMQCLVTVGHSMISIFGTVVFYTSPSVMVHSPTMTFLL